MSKAFFASTIVLAGALAQNGTFDVNYPLGKDRGSYENAVGHYVTMLGGKYTQPEGITISFGAAKATITYKGATTIPSGTKVNVQLEEVGDNPDLKGDALVAGDRIRVAMDRLKTTVALRIELGAPITADADGISASQSVGSGVAALLNGALLSTIVGGKMILDQPRNVVAAWTNTAICTVTGKDEYGQVMIEQSSSSTSMTGKKAFKEITSVVFNASVTGATVGTGDVLGLPMWLPNAAHVQAELEDNASATAGTFVAGLAVNTPSTATTADVRGTYDPNSACDGAKSFSILALLNDPTFLGNDQYDG